MDEKERMTGQGRNGINVALAESLKELALQRPFEKITIKEITDKAGVIRPTFYNHFQDKYELLEWVIQTDLLEPMRPLLRNGMVQEAVVLLFANLEKEKSFYMRVAKMEGPITFSEVANHCVQEILLEIITELMSGKEPEHPWLTPVIIAKYYAQSMCFAALEWIASGMKFSPQEMAEAYQYIITRSMDDIVRNLL